jgi:hypothetical protein
MIRQAFLVSILLSWATAIGVAQEAGGVLARAAVERTELLIGDQLWLTVKISAPPGTDVGAIRLDSLEANPAIELIETRPASVVTESPELLIDQRFRIQTFDTGYVYVPQLAVTYQTPDGQTDTAYTRRIPLAVRGLPVTEENELQDIKDIIEEEARITDYWPVFLGVGLLVLAGLAFSFWRNRAARQAPAPPPPPVPPHERALQRLAELDAKQLWQAGEIKAFQTELTYILRAYLEERFDVPALESTTRQLERDLERRRLLGTEQRRDLAELLRLADTVKFAKAEPPADVHQRGLDRVRAFVEATIPPPPAPPEQSTDA